MSIYTKLSKIKRPVLLVVASGKRPMFNRYRILFPDGSLIFTFNSNYSTHFERSCFNVNYLNKTKPKPDFKNLQESITIMKIFDEANKLKVVSVLKL